jgi:heme-degrading monooxygenase HmoA
MTKAAPFAVLYRWTVDPEHEAYFIERWRMGTQLLRDEHGALGSCLTRAENGDFVAFARWPDEEARSAAFASRGPPEPWPGILCFEETKLTVVEDLLTRR